MRTFKIGEQLLYFLPPHAKQDFSFHALAGCASSLPQDAVHLEMPPEPLAWHEGAGTSLALPHPDSSGSVAQEAAANRTDGISKSLWLSLPSGLALSSHQKLGYRHLPRVTDQSSVPESTVSHLTHPEGMWLPMAQGPTPVHRM